jgi:hypothetical protein
MEALINIDLTFDDESPTFEMPHNASGDIMHSSGMICFSTGSSRIAWRKVT